MVLPGMDLYLSDSDEATAASSAAPDITPDDPYSPSMTLPPLHLLYATPQDAINTIDDLAKEQGYAFVCKINKLSKLGEEKKIVLQCDRGGKYVSRIKDEDRKRKTTTCVLGVLSNSLSVVQTHQEGLATHEMHRRRELEIKKPTITMQLRLQIPTRQIPTCLRDEDPTSWLLPVDINNLRMRLSQEFLNGRTPIQTLLMELPRDGKWLFRTELDDDNHIMILFCMHA
ncbi:hypothetical protein N7448_010976 [Penicillium atrosanguineum]|nr:hypothetical protein N7448_010976 [Penicillium atrosanguineum]